MIINFEGAINNIAVNVLSCLHFIVIDNDEVSSDLYFQQIQEFRNLTNYIELKLEHYGSEKIFNKSKIVS